jgi:chemotaxis protein MotB
MAAAKSRANEPEPRPIIVKKIIVEGHGGHHGGAWKVAYADFVTAMMAFFLLMWLLGATTEKQRKGLADYFTPTLVQTKQESAGSDGLFGGDSFIAKENYPTTGGQGNLAITIPRDSSGVKDVGGESLKNSERQKFERLKSLVEQKIASEKSLRNLKKNVRFTETREGLRIDLIDEAEFAMFAMGTEQLVPQARVLLEKVAQVLGGVPNDVIVRGHTDGLPYASGRTMNNWMLSSARAEATRVALAANGVATNRFARIEGVADREPFVPGDRYDPRNRRISVILAWSKGGEQARPTTGIAREREDKALNGSEELGTKRKIMMRDNGSSRQLRDLAAADLGRTGLPGDAVVINANAIPKRNQLTPPGKTAATAKKSEGGER